MWIFRFLLGQKFIKYITPAFNDDKGEASSRKWSAFTLMVLLGICHIFFLYFFQQSDGKSDDVHEKYLDTLFYIMILDLTGGLLYLGIVTTQNVLMAMKGKTETETTKTSTSINNGGQEPQ